MINFDDLLKIRTMTDREMVEVALRLAARDMALFLILADNVHEDFVVNGVTVSISPTQMTEYRDFHDKVRLIKRMREDHNIGLREAKELSELLEEKGVVKFNTQSYY